MLNSARLYLDYQQAKLNKIDASVSSHLKKFKRTIYNTEPDYRLMYTIRNVLQHREIPISVTRGIKRVEDDNKTKIKLSTRPSLILELILSDNKLNKNVREDLENEKINKKPITAVICHFIELMRQIHDEFRNATSHELKKSEGIFESHLKEIYGPDTINSDQGQRTAMVLKNGINNTTDKERINEFADTLITNLKYMIAKNTSLVNLENRIVSNE